MALAPRLSNTGATTAADSVCALLNNGYLRIYDGAQPADANTAITTQNLLAELRWGASAFSGSVNGAASANAIANVNAGATGTAAWFRALKSDGTTVIFDGSVGTVGANMNLNSTAIQINATVSITSFTYTQQES